VPDEEIPQRIGFVSDRVYEPSLMLRWWRAFWGSAPKAGVRFSGHALGSHSGFPRFTGPVRTTLITAPTVDVARLQADFSRQMNEAVEKAVAASDVRHEQRTSELLTAASRRFDAQREADLKKGCADLGLDGKVGAARFSRG